LLFLVYSFPISFFRHDCFLSTELFLKSNEVHRYNTRSAGKGNFFQKDGKLEIQKRFFSRFGTLLWNNIAPALPKTVYRKTIGNLMFNLISAEDDYVEINKIVDFLKPLA